MKTTLLAILLFLPLLAAAQDHKMTNTLLIDDFSAEQSALGTLWEGFSDRVMGGRSDLNARIVQEEGASVFNLSGSVSLENNGGFIQVRLFLDPKKRPFDASTYTGIGLRVRGLETGYYIHVRTPRTVFPWSYFTQEIPVSTEWNTVYLPFSGFEAENLRANTVNAGKLNSIAIVAAKRAFTADLFVDSIFLYK